MLVDGLNLAEGSSAQNFTISSGSSFPLSPLEGEAFYRNDGANEGLYLYDGAQWVQAGSFDETASRSISGAWSFTQPISGATPVSASDLTTKQYVDNIATGLDVKLSVKAATTANITLSGAQTIDGIALVAGDRVLVKDQTAGAQNGLYVVGAGAWARTTDADNSPVGEVTSGMFTLVTSGTANANKGFVLTSADPITLGSTALVFTQFSGGASAPTLTSTRVGFGSALNVLTGSAKFTWDDTNSALTLGLINSSPSASIFGPHNAASGQPAILTISGGGGGNGIAGGTLTLIGGTGGNGSSSGGSVIVQGGSTGGYMTGGSVFINAGKSPDATGGSIVFQSAPLGVLTERLRITNTGAWSIGTGGAAYGTSGQVLTSAGNGVPSWQTPTAAAPTLTATQIGFGSGTNVLSGSIRLTWDNATNILNLGDGTYLTTTATISPKLKTENAVGTLLELRGGSTTAGQNGGGVLIAGGTGNGSTTGAPITISAGPATFSTIGIGGILSLNAGTGTQVGGYVVISTSPTTSLVERLRILANGAWSIGTGGAAYGTAGQVLTSNGNAAPTWSTAQTLGSPAPATTATTGFAYIPVSTGTPTGVPTAIAGYAPMVADSAGSKLWVYIGGAWKSVTLA